MSIIPTDSEKRLGQRKEAYRDYQPADLPNWKDFAVKKGIEESSMKVTGQFLDGVFQRNPHGVRLFSPDELESNKLDACLNHTSRNMQWDQFSRARGGRVIEVLSEHLCQGFLQGYTLTGRVGLFPSYESFLGIITTMMVQYSKFNKMVSPVTSQKPSVLISNDINYRLKRQNGTMTSLVSTILKLALGPDRSTMDSLIRTRLLSAQF